MTSSSTKPLWSETKQPKFPRLTKSRGVDVVVIGGGITGLSAAYFLKQAGKTVCLIERDTLGSGDTGHTTAHLTCVTDVRLKDLVARFDRERAALAWYAGQAATDLIEQIVTQLKIECQFRRVPGFLHGSLETDEDESKDLEDEAALARELGFDGQYISRVPLVNKSGMLLRNQAKFRPLEYLSALANFIDGDGSSVHEHTEASDVEEDPLVVVAGDARIECNFVVMATEIPLVGKASMANASLLQARLIPYSTYVVSGRVRQGIAPEMSLWDTSSPYYYLRIDAEPDHDRVIFGGKDHKTGQVDNTEGCYDALTAKLLEILPDVKLDYRWSGQVIESNDGLPLMGEIADRQFVATGFNGNGITFATIAGLMARDALLKQENPWQDLFSLDRKQIRGGTWDYVKQNLQFPYYYLADRLRTPKKESTRDIKRGQGKVISLDGQRVACSRDARGRLQQVSAICPHMGCVVHWNDAEHTWDCPCHGSRFHADGEVLAGPAESPLEPIERKPVERKKVARQQK